MAIGSDPYRGYNFRVEITGITRAGFRECSGLDFSRDPIDYREGSFRDVTSQTEGYPLTVRKVPGLVKHSNITLKWGITDDHDFWIWLQQYLIGDIQRTHGSILLLNDGGEEKMRWNFFEAWPTKWTGPSFNATANEIAIETLEIVYERLEKHSKPKK